jgi:hypothetical protein
MIGLRVFDVGLLIVWLVWFFRLRDDDDSSEDDGGGGGGPRPPEDSPDGGGGLGRPLGRAKQGRNRLRDHRPARQTARRRGAEPLPRPLPVRVRRPRTPAPARRVASR